MKLLNQSPAKKSLALVKKKSVVGKPSNEKSFTVVAIGASVGGLDAMGTLLKNLPDDTGMAFIYVQHLNPDHKSLLSSILSKTTKMKVQEIENMEHMAPNNVYVIPYNKIIQVINGHIILLPRPQNSSIISIDVLFSSLAQTHKANVVGIILSGNASDGTIGVNEIKDEGGITMAQDKTAQAISMPNSAISSGAIDFVLSPKKMALKLIGFSKNGLPSIKTKGKPNEEILADNNPDLKTIFGLLHKETGVDFSHYKMPTIKRRLNHKMTQCGATNIKDYLKILNKQKGELHNLYDNLLINVTDFFRDVDAFAYLKTTFLPKLLKSKLPNETLRIWVPACSTGEEAYSIAMLLTELQDKKTKKIPIQIFATDLSDNAIASARIGEFVIEKMKHISKKQLERFFVKSGDNYRIAKEIREMCVFAPHNVLRDPPFSKMDFISCCNLLIYFDAAAQKKVFATFHFALNDKGHLMLGKAESIGTASLLFSRVNSKFKLFSRKKNTGIPKILELTPHFQRTNLASKKPEFFPKNSVTNPIGIENAIDIALLTNYMPACAVVNKEMEILQLRGPISLFLRHSSGKANLNILKMARPEFAFELRTALNHVLKTKTAVHKSGIEIEIEASTRMMSMDVSTLKIEWDEPLALVVFKLKEITERFNSVKNPEKTISVQKDKRIKYLTDELSNTRIEMISIIESQEAMHEELQAANEEIVSSNEEFQTLNEELETSKEEIQASNEELLSTNHELQTRNDLLTESYEYSEAIIATLHEPMLILNKQLHVKSANKSFYNKFQVKREDTEGKYLFDLGNHQWNIPELRELLNNILSKNNGFENFEVTHVFPEIGEKIMSLNAHLIHQKTHSEQLILLAIEDVTELSYHYLKEKNSLSLIEASLDPLVTINTEGKITDMNQATVNITGISRNKLKNSDFFDYFTESKRAKEFYKEVFEKESIADYPLTIKHTNGKLTDVLFNGSIYKDDKGTILGIVIVARDITDQKRIARELSEVLTIAEDAKIKAEKATEIAEVAVKAKQQFLSNMSHEIRTPMNAIIGFTNVVLKTDLTEKQKEYLTAIKLSGDALIVLINDILDLAKVDSGKMTFENAPFKIVDSLTSMLHLFEIKINEKNLLLEKNYDTRIPEIVVGDQIRLHQIILNLVGNAIKFTTTGKIVICLDLINEDDDSVLIEFSISDTGIGIAKNKLTGIFENFQQASSGTTRLYGGTGLGLAIVKQLVELQGGTLNVISELDKGSTFSFQLKFSKGKTLIESVEEKIELQSPTKRIKVLVVEDIALNRLLMKTLLDDFGFDYDMAENGKIAIEKLQTDIYDIILMDLQMPEMNGFEATEYIRHTLNSKISIIALTADVTTVDLDKCKAVGLNDYIAKPIDEKLLYNKIIKLVKKPMHENFG